ncbi:MAG: GNAT family N-acetyltransferase [Anaerolineae bacterium]
MIAETACGRQSPGKVRPVEPGRDMRAIADLIEIAFRDELDRTGNSLVADMRQMAMLGPLLTLADCFAPLPGGFVWEVNGRIAGNVTLTPDDAAGRRWFVSNVAVHPDRQGRGIARALMEAALEHVRRRGGRRVLLQVRQDNDPAQRLYRGLGFVRYDTVAEMLRPGLVRLPPPSHIPVRRVSWRDWRALADLALQSMPPGLADIRGISSRTFRPSLWGCLTGSVDALLSGKRSERWAVGGEALEAVVSLLAYDGRSPARLDLAARPRSRGLYEGVLADWGLSVLGRWGARSVASSVSVTHPEALQALEQRRFAILRTLDQLALELG